jgi:hypothetical protein
MPRIIRPFALLATLAGVAYVVRIRRLAVETGSPVSELIEADLRSFVTHRFDPVVMRLGLVGGRRSPWATIEHVGRVTGAVHRTPVTPRLVDGAVIIPLPYGTDVQWVRNVMAAGHCRLQYHETIYELDEPAIILAEQNPALSAAEHQILDETTAHYLRLRVLDRAPGTFAEPAHEFTTHAPPVAVPDIEWVHPAPEAAPVG